MRAPMLALALLLAQPLGLQEAMERARAANPELALARQNVRVAEAGVEAAGQLSNPVLSGSFGPDEPQQSATLEVKAPLLGQRGAAVAAAEREADGRRGGQKLQEGKV